MTIEIKVDTSGLDRILSDIPAAIERAKRVALNQIGNTIKNHSIDSFKDESLRPSPWPARKDNVDPDRPLLYKHGDMKNTIGYKLPAPDTVFVGSKADYAKYHQTGTRNMPARPIFPVKDGNLTPDVHQKIMRKVDRAFADALPKGSIPRPIWPGSNA